MNELRALVDRAEREELGAAQGSLLRFALGEEEAEQRREALDGLLADLSRDDLAGGRSRAQQAFHTALLSMIERTREMVGAREG
ncbi:hypothetical protein ACRAWG_16080 [Methylobacterium sp. P31]